MKRTISPGILAICLTLFWCASLFGQRINIRKDLILLDNVPSFHFAKVKGADRASWEVKTLEGDLVMNITGKVIQLPRLRHETDHLRYLYYQVDFAQSGRTAFRYYIVADFRYTATREFIASGLFADGKFFPEKEEDYIGQYCRFAPRKAELEAIVLRRNALKEDKEYQAYLRKLEDRNAAFPVEVTPEGKIIVNKVEIGYIKTSNDLMGISNSVYTKSRGFAGSIFYETDKKRVVIRSVIDGEVKEYFIEGPFDAKRLREAVLHLVDNAYL